MARLDVGSFSASQRSTQQGDAPRAHIWEALQHRIRRAADLTDRLQARRSEDIAYSRSQAERPGKTEHRRCWCRPGVAVSVLASHH